MSRARLDKASAFTLMELLVVLGIIGALIGLLFPAVQQVREAAARAQCQNNLKQLGLAAHHCHDAYDYLPPGLGWFPGNQYTSGGAFGSGLFHLLPFLEQDNLHNSSLGGGFYFADNNNVYQKQVKVFLCPLDPSVANGQAHEDDNNLWGASSYAGNAQVFCQVSPEGQLLILAQQKTS